MQQVRGTRSSCMTSLMVIPVLHNWSMSPQTEGIQTRPEISESFPLLEEASVNLTILKRWEYKQGKYNRRGYCDPKPWLCQF